MCQSLILRGIDVGISDAQSDKKQLSLSEVYIDLNTTAQEKTEHKQRQKPDEIDDPKSKPLPALTAAVKHQKLIFLGDPGSGKTTLINYISHGLAANGLEKTSSNKNFLPGWPEKEKSLLPVQIILRDFVRGLLEKLPSPDPCYLFDFINDRLKANNQSEAQPPLKKALENGDAIVLLDGLDEVPTKAQRSFVRDAVEKFAGRYENCRFVVTCRTLSYEDPAWRLAGFPSYELAPFNEEQINKFISAWYTQLVHHEVFKTQDEGDSLAKKLQAAVRKPDMWRLAKNPLLLTVMALVHTHKGRLPEARALLYEETVDILLWRWEQIKTGADKTVPRLRQLLLDAGRSEVDLKKVLWKLAFEAHGKSSAKNKDDEKLADIDELSLEKALAELNDSKRD